MKQEMITPSETLQLNEILALKSLSLTKSLLMSPMVSDPDLKDIMKRDAAACEGHIRKLKSFMEKSTITSDYNSGMFTSDRRSEA